MSNGPLHGIKVLDFTSMISGPYCTRLLADCGAEVVKVEARSGDLMRMVAPVVGGRSRYFAAFNCGKQSISLDLKDEEDRKLALELAASCDVFVENNRPGVMAKMGLGYDDVSAINPGVVYASISGFGQSGPMSGFPAYAPVVHASSGYDMAFQSQQRQTEEPPITSIQSADVLSAVFAFGAIQTGLVKRSNTGKGDWIDISLVESIMAMITADLQVAQVDGESVATYPPIKTSDHYIAVCVVSPKTFAGLLEVIGDPTLERPKSAAENLELMATLGEWAKSRSSHECQEELMRHGVPCSVYETPESILENEHLKHRGTFASIETAGYRHAVNNAPFRFQNSDSGIVRSAPELDADRETILSSWLHND